MTSGTGGERFTGHGSEWRDANLSPAEAEVATSWVEARINNGRVLVDTNGDGSTDLTIVLTGLVNEDQLSAANFAFL